MDDRAHGRLLTVTAFSTVIQYANWIIQHMASQSQEPTSRKQRAWWSDAEEVAFLNYLVEHQSQATRSAFKNLTITVAINSISHLHERGLVKTKVSGIHKWNMVSLVFLDLQIITDNLTHPVEGCIHCDCRIQDLGVWWNLE